MNTGLVLVLNDGSTISGFLSNNIRPKELISIADKIGLNVKELILDDGSKIKKSYVSKIKSTLLRCDKLFKIKVTFKNKLSSISNFQLTYNVYGYLIAIKKGELYNTYNVVYNEDNILYRIIQYVILKKIRELILNNIIFLKIIDIDNFYQEYEKIFYKTLNVLKKNNILLDNSTIEHLKIEIFFKLLKIEKLAPILLDDNVTEIFILSQSQLVYLDHIRMGRCITNVKVTEEDLKNFVKIIALTTGHVPTWEKPSIKVEWFSRFFKTRVAIDGPPLVKNGWNIDIRKHPLKPLTIFELISQNSLSIEAAAYIILVASLRLANIIIIGEPGSGKTTLLNSIDMTIPSHYRRLYIEDAIESLELSNLGKFQVKLKVNPMEYDVNTMKEVEITKSLHRKPDVLILGELQTKEHFNAAFMAMNSGLLTLQTCHAISFEQLFRRVVYVYQIPKEFFNNCIIIVMKRDIVSSPEKRFVNDIIYTIIVNNKIKVLKVFERVNNKLERILPEKADPILRNVKEYSKILKNIKEVLEKNVKIGSTNIVALCMLIDKISRRVLK